MLVVATRSELAPGMLAAGVGPELPPDARCPRCEGPLGRWPGYARLVRHDGQTTRLWVRRCVCRSCGRTHALLPSFLLAYRRDTVAVIGAALVAAATGAGHRAIADRADLSPGTVRGWLRRARQRREGHAKLLRWLASAGHHESPVPAPDATELSGLLDLIADAYRVAREQFKAPERCPFNIASAITAGQLLGPT